MACFGQVVCGREAKGACADNEDALAGHGWRPKARDKVPAWSQKSATASGSKSCLSLARCPSTPTMQPALVVHRVEEAVGFSENPDGVGTQYVHTTYPCSVHSVRHTSVTVPRTTLDSPKLVVQFNQHPHQRGVTAHAQGVEKGVEHPEVAS